MQVIEVNTAAHKKDFLLLPKQIYASDANWIQPLDNDIESVFDATKNKFFRHGECTRWILRNS
ncbi:MAG: GNAT family N-acetyltransferase, partial [Bacteroidota bacterium]